MKKILITITLLGLTVISNAQFKLCYWKINRFNYSNAQSHVRTITQIIDKFDVIVLPYEHAKEPIFHFYRLFNLYFNKLGLRYSMRIVGSNSIDLHSKKYLIIWDAEKINLVGNILSESELTIPTSNPIYYITLKTIQHKQQFTLVLFQSTYRVSHLSEEINLVYRSLLNNLNRQFIVCGEFRKPIDSTLFLPLTKRSLYPIFVSHKSLSADSKFKNTEFDHIFIDSRRHANYANGLLYFYALMKNESDGLNISNHLPIFTYVALRKSSSS